VGVLPDWMIERDIKIEPFAPQQHRPGIISYGVTSYGYDTRLGYKFKAFMPRHPFSIIDPKNFDDRMMEEVDLTPPKDHTCIDETGTDTRLSCKACAYDSNNTFIVIPPNSFVLGESLERFWIPRDVLCVVVGKSTYARTGLVVNVTPGEPEWGGKWTIELSNTTPLPMKVYAGEGIMQCLFFRGDGVSQNAINAIQKLLPKLSISQEDQNKILTTLNVNVTCETSYADKKGRYQNQTGLTLPFVEGEKK